MIKTKIETINCPSCDGRGKYKEMETDGDGYRERETGRKIRCDNCNGTGRVKQEYRVEFQTDEEYDELVDKFYRDKEWVEDALINEKHMSSYREEYLKNWLKKKKPKRTHGESYL